MIDMDRSAMDAPQAPEARVRFADTSSRSSSSAASPSSGSSRPPSRAEAYAVVMSWTHRKDSSASRPTYSRLAMAILKSSNIELNQVTWLESIQSDEMA